MLDLLATLFTVPLIVLVPAALIVATMLYKVFTFGGSKPDDVRTDYAERRRY